MEASEEVVVLVLGVIGFPAASVDVVEVEVVVHMAAALAAWAEVSEEV